MRLKLFLSFTLIVLISVLLVAVIVRVGAVNEVRAYMFRGGMYGLSELATSLEDYYQNEGSWRGVQATINSAHRGSGMGGMMNQRLILADSNGIVVEDTQDTAIGDQLEQSQLDNSIPLFVDDETVGYLFSEGGMGLVAGSEQQLYTRLNRAVIIAGLVAIGLGLVLALVLAFTMLRPIRALTFASQRLAEGDLSQRVAVHSDDELATLGQAFNRMADSLQQGEESRRAMTADIAHELRTPLAVQRANLEALQDGVYPLKVENLTPIVEQNLMLTHLVDDLRTLALTDAGQIDLERTPTDIVTLTERVVEHFQPQATAQQVSMTINSPSAALPLLTIDPIRVEQMLSNLLSNALRYTPQAGKIEVAIADMPGAIQLTIHDSGPGIPEEAVPLVFDRFYRVDKSRSRSEGGSGLGLAIARNLARAHGGDLTASNHKDGGALFTLTLPVG